MRGVVLSVILLSCSSSSLALYLVGWSLIGSWFRFMFGDFESAYVDVTGGLVWYFVLAFWIGGSLVSHLYGRWFGFVIWRALGGGG